MNANVTRHDNLNDDSNRAFWILSPETPELAAREGVMTCLWVMRRPQWFAGTGQ